MADANPQTPVADVNTAPVVAPAAPGRPAFFVRIGAVVGLFGLSFAGTWLLTRGSNEPTSVQVETPKGPKHPALLKTDPIDVKQAETYLRSGNHATALTCFEAMASEAKGRASAWIQFRIGICREALGQWEKALAAFRAAASEAELPSARHAAQLAQGRVFLKIGRATEAKKLLLPLVLQAGAVDPNETAFLAEVHYLYALALAQAAAPRDDVSPGSVRSSRLRFGAPEQPLRWPTLLPPREPAATGADLTVEIRPDVPHLERAVRAVAPAVPVKQLLERVATLGGMQIDWSPAAQQRVHNRTVTLVLEGWPWIDLVEALAQSADLICTVEPKTLRLQTAEDLSKEAVISRQRTLVLRALQVVVFQFPGHSLTPVTYLETGNYHANAGNLAEAVTWYEKIVKEFPVSHLTAEAHYNLGVIHRRAGDQVQARKRFYGVVDQAPAHPAAPTAYWHIGLSHLEDGKPKDAVRPLRQALGLAVASPHRPSIVLTAAGAYLAAGEPFQAHDLILKHRPSLKDSPFRQMGAFIDCYALYLIGVKAKTPRRDQGQLMATLLEVRDDAGLGPFGQWLRAKAYSDLKMFDQTAQVCEKSLPNLQGAWAEEMTFLLAEANASRMKPAEATKLFTDLAGKDKSRWAAQAQLRLAQIALGEDRVADCVRACRKLWNEQPAGVEPSAILQLVGEAFERLGDPTQAARCYAGQAPQWPDI